MSHSESTTTVRAQEALDDQPCSCFHCGQPVPAGLNLKVEIDGRREPMCCYGCQAVAQAIVSAGHEDFYRHRTGKSPTGHSPVPDFIRQARIYDHPEVQKSFVRTEDGDIREAALILEGIVCAACIWLNERHLAGLPGVLEVQINYATHRARIRWDETRIRLSDILQAIHAIGYQAHPYDPQRQQQAYEAERRRHLRRIGVAGVLGMQVMILSVALYAGAWSGMEADFTTFFRWLGLGLTTPVLLYSGAPFFRGAWRDLYNFSVGMDVPVTLGILVAFGGSLVATWTGHGHVYYDSVVMFIFFLLVSRYFEIMARKRSAETAERLSQSLPAMATRLVTAEGSEVQELVPAVELEPGDRILVRPGETLPADGHVETGHSTVNEALLTGEGTPLAKAPGSWVIGGSINNESPLQVIVDKVGPESVLAEIVRLMERAQNEKPAITRLADRTASWFVGTVLVSACLVGLYWWQQAPESWLPIVVAMLVVTCPCALSLATPTAISATSGTLMANGMLTVRGHGLETLARSTHVVFDKTGTLTQGEPALIATEVLSGLAEADIRRITATLESCSEHPVGRALYTAFAGQGTVAVTGLANHPGAGVSATISATDYFLGSAGFVRQHSAADIPASLLGEAGGQTGIRVLLADRQQLHALFILRDKTRRNAASVIGALRRAGQQILLMSGDNMASSQQLAGEVGITQVYAGLRPQDKLDRVQALQREGAVVTMVGDGINDAPVLAAADISIAMQSAAQLSHASADMILLSDRLESLVSGLGIARKTLNIIRQNLAWAVSYNLVALPAAALGYIAPWMAAIGMSASSLVVVLNALRLTRHTDWSHTD